MLISIIIPAIDEANNIERAVTAAQALQPHEVLVVDGGSQDATPTLAAARGATVVRSPRGRALQQNAGARLATGEVLLFLHADCWLAPGGLEQIATVLRDENILGGAFRHRIEAAGIAYRLIERGDSLRVRLCGMAYGDQGLFVRRAAFQQLGGFPEVRLMEDVRFMRQLRRVSRIALLPGPLYTSARRWQKHGVVRQTLRNWRLLAAEKLGASPDRLADDYAPHQAPKT